MKAARSFKTLVPTITPAGRQNTDVRNMNRPTNRHEKSVAVFLGNWIKQRDHASRN